MLSTVLRLDRGLYCSGSAYGNEMGSFATKTYEKGVRVSRPNKTMRNSQHRPKWRETRVHTHLVNTVVGEVHGSLVDVTLRRGFVCLGADADLYIITSPGPHHEVTNMPETIRVGAVHL